jgi:hypothetical protein
MPNEPARAMLAYGLACKAQEIGNWVLMLSGRVGGAYGGRLTDLTNDERDECVAILQRAAVVAGDMVVLAERICPAGTVTMRSLALDVLAEAFASLEAWRGQ